MKDKIRNIIDLLERQEVKINTKAMLIFADAEEAFDNISWNFMKQNLVKMEVGQNFVNGINGIYSEQKAKNHCK